MGKKEGYPSFITALLTVGGLRLQSWGEEGSAVEVQRLKRPRTVFGSPS